MLFDIVSKYTVEEKKTLRDLRKEVLLDLSRDHDPKKIISFLNKSWIIAFDDEKKTLHMWVSNEFLLTQIKKFFHKSLLKIVKNRYNSPFTIQYHIYSPFQKKTDDLQVNLVTLYNLSIVKKDEKTYNKGSSSLQLANDFGVKMMPDYTFDNLVVGWSNDFAISAAKSVADKPWESYNPLFVYWDVGLGKTHILQAIANHVLHNTKKTVVYLPATNLIDTIITATRKNKLSQIYSKFANIDVLILDDIQFLAWKDKTQEIFLNIFNDFVTSWKQIILSWDQPPKELINIEPRLKSRFAKWLIVDIQKPDYETRMAILQSKLSRKGEKIDFDLLTIIAKHITNNVRELEWALNVLLTKKNLTHCEFDEKSMYSCLSTLWYYSNDDREATAEDISYMNTSSVLSFSKIVEFVAKYYDLAISDLKSAKRSKEISQTRQLLMVIAKNNFGWTLEKIWDYFGGKNHAAVIYACKNFEKKLKKDNNLSHDYNIIMEKVK